MSESLLEVRRVSRTFRRRSGFGRDQAVVAAVADVSLSVEAGEIVALVGGSGAGKSTVGRMVLGLEEPDEGEVLFDGQELTAMSESERRRARQQMHLVFQDPYQSLHPGMRIGEVVEEPLVIAGAQRQERRARTLAALEHAGITPADRYVDRFPHQLSGGQRQRVAMARALIGRPRLVVADEPTSMLDASLCAGILQLILDMRHRQGTAFIFITHDLAVARYVSDRMIVMSQGRVIEDGPTETVIDCPCEEYTRLLLAASEGKLDEVEALADTAG